MLVNVQGKVVMQCAMPTFAWVSCSILFIFLTASVHHGRDDWQWQWKSIEVKIPACTAEFCYFLHSSTVFDARYDDSCYMHGDRMLVDDLKKLQRKLVQESDSGVTTTTVVLTDSTSRHGRSTACIYM